MYGQRKPFMAAYLSRDPNFFLFKSSKRYSFLYKNASNLHPSDIHGVKTEGRSGQMQNQHSGGTAFNNTAAKSPVASINDSNHKVSMENHFGKSDDEIGIIDERFGNRLPAHSMLKEPPHLRAVDEARIIRRLTARLRKQLYLRRANKYVQRESDSNVADHRSDISSQQLMVFRLKKQLQALRTCRTNEHLQRVRSNMVDHKVNLENHFGKSGDDVSTYEQQEGGSRLLPSSMVIEHPRPRSTCEKRIIRRLIRRLKKCIEKQLDATYEIRVFQAALQGLSQPKVEATLPDGLLTVLLLRHQRIALAWLVQKETASLHCLGGILADDQGLGKTVSMIALIQSQRDLQSKSAYGDIDKKKKNDTFKLKEEEVLEEVMDTGESNDQKIPEVSTAVPAGTLVVCPASILRQWARELNDKVADEAKLTVLTYHGSTRTKNPDELAKYDVVLTTYSIVTNEVPKQRVADNDDRDSNADKKERKGKKGTMSSSSGCGGGPLGRVSWFRVILDEAQTIKNHRTQAAKACCGLRAKRRWCLSGTPMQNRIDDLYSYFRFLKYHPYDVYESFSSALKNRTFRKSGEGFNKLQVVLQTILLRRTKETLVDGKPILTLPAKSVSLVKVEFTDEEKTFYSQLEANACIEFKEYANAKTVRKYIGSILEMLLRLRQACDHHLLLIGRPSKPVAKNALEMAKILSPDTWLRLLNLLEDSFPLCSECSDPPEDAVVTLCGHVFCYQCVAEHLTGDDNLCPAPNCKNHLSDDIVFSRATLSSCVPVDLADNATNSLQVIDKSMILHDSYSSSKIRAAMKIIKSNCKLKNPNEISSAWGNGITLSSQEQCDADFNAEEHSNSHPEAPVKTIVFSQWTGMLDLLEIPLNHSGIQYRRLDGAMSLNLRDQAVTEFNTDPKVMVMLMSLKAGNVGLNMIAASHVILMDPWWNPTTEDQAIDRAHRIGQTRPVTVSRLIVSNTVEDRILALQEKKRKLVASAFVEDQAGRPATRLTVKDLRYLFKV